MKRYVASVVNDLMASDRRAYIRRAMWPDLELRLSVCYRELARTKDIQCLGGVYLKCSQSRDPGYDFAGLSPYNCLNQAEVSLGRRALSVYHTIAVDPLGQAKAEFESGASIVFSQDVTGQVAVLLHPYKSKLASVNEDNILLSFGMEPVAISEADIRRYLRTFLRYSLATSGVRYANLADYLFRLRLLFNDRRNKRAQRHFAVVLAERLALLALAVLGVVATIWTSSKWPLQ